MTGVVVSTATRSGAASPLRAPSGQFFATGLMERGDTAAPTLLRGMADVDKYLGTRQTYGALYDQLKTYFDEGGLQAYVARVVGPAATKGFLVLNDRAGSPLATLRVEAQNAGAWSSNLTVEVQDGATTNTVRIIVRLSGNVVEDFNNISSPTDAVAKFSLSPYVRLIDQGSVTASPGNRPAALAATPLSAGSDDRASVTATHYVNALALFTDEYGDGAVAIPGQNGATIYNGLIAHCVATNQRIALLAAPKNETVANLKTTAAGINSEYAGLFAPWVKTNDGGSGTREISPEGYVAAARARAHEEVGPWRSPAGSISKARVVQDVVQKFTEDEIATLGAAKVSVIRNINSTVRLYGWRSLSSDTDNYAYLKDRDTLNTLVFQTGLLLEDYVHRPIDTKNHLLSQLQSDLVGLVKPMADNGAFFPFYEDDGVTEIDPGFLVETGSSVNTRATLAQNEIRARLSVRIAPVADTVTLNIVKVGLLSAL